MKNFIALIFALLIALASLQPAMAQSPDNLVKASGMAIAAYSKNIAERHTTPGADGDYMRNINNYDIGISQNSNYIIFIFLPSDKNIAGGGGEIWISKKNMRIEKTSNYF
ncbi:hypothetical protein [Lysobacter sp. ESA13C]|uniref:hypothetical protein n=1 Tax=Lysobacter sp. ESA13C TaxID=2862676 RepID=UPI001CC10CA4|nr:hypothetical protein [Lysobacter sp. ESA13C]